MARETKAELLEKLEQRDRIIEMMQQEIQRLERQIDEMLPDDHPKLRNLKSQLDRMTEMYKQSEISRDAAIRKADRLQTQLAEASQKLSRLGRPSIDQEIIDQIHELRDTGMSIRAIAAELGVSPASVGRYVSKTKETIMQDDESSASTVQR